MKQTTVRIPEALSDEVETAARVRDVSVNAFILGSLAGEIEKVKADKDFTDRAKALLGRDKELLERLAEHFVSFGWPICRGYRVLQTRG